MEEESDNENDNDDKNEIINGYRYFFLSKKSKSIDSTAGKKAIDDEESKTISKSKQQESMKKLVESERTLAGTSSSSRNRPNQWDSEEMDSKTAMTTTATSTTTRTTTKTTESSFSTALIDRLNEMMELQRKTNECMQRGFEEMISQQKRQQQQVVVDSSNINSNNSSSTATMMIASSQMQLQLQLQVQQLMTQLNAALAEITMQRNEISKLNELFRKVYHIFKF